MENEKVVTSVTVVGLGKLGACMAAAIASRGFNVIGVDISDNTVQCINNGNSPVSETGLGTLIATQKERLKATTSYQDAILQSQICFVIVPTPSDSDGSFSLQYAKHAFQAIGKALKEKQGYYLVVMTSTVLPGACRHGLIPILEKASGKRAGIDFGFCYSPEFIALGSVINDFLNPDFALVGELDRQSGDWLTSIYARIMHTQASCQRMSLENAELAKVALNSYVTMKITFANTLAEICQVMPEGNVDSITTAIGLDARIGTRYLKGGSSFGGPCFPRDNMAFDFIAKQMGINADLAGSTAQLNQQWLENSVARIQELVPSESTIAILGLAYKPETPVIEASHSILMINSLLNFGYRIVAFDPLANENAKEEFKHRIIIQNSIEKCLHGAHAVVIATPDPAFKNLTHESFVHCSTPVIVYDLWRLLTDTFIASKEVRYIPYGIGGRNTNITNRFVSLWNG